MCPRRKQNSQNFLPTGHTTLLRRWINVIDVATTLLNQRRFNVKTTSCVQWKKTFFLCYFLTGHTTLLRRWINANDVDSTLKQHSINVKCSFGWVAQHLQYLAHVMWCWPNLKAAYCVWVCTSNDLYESLFTSDGAETSRPFDHWSRHRAWPRRKPCLVFIPLKIDLTLYALYNSFSLIFSYFCIV